MAGIKQNLLAKKSGVINHLNVSPRGTLTIKAGYVYYENSSSDYAQIVTTDEYGNIQPVVLSTTNDYTEIISDSEAQSIGESNEISL